MTTFTAKARTARRRLALIGIFSVGALGLVACSAAEPTPIASPDASASPTPTPSAFPTGETPPPTSEADALESSSAAAQEYMRIWAQIQVENPEDSSAIDVVAIEQAAQRVHDGVARQVAEERVGSGASTYEVLPESVIAEAAQGGTPLPFSMAMLVGCFDTTELNFTYADGSAVQMQPNRRGLVEMTVVYSEFEQRWLVKDLIDPDVVEPC